MDKNTKPKTTLKDIRSKMKRLALQANKQVKEEKQREIKQEKQKDKASKQKQKITQRVKININIPSQKTSTPQIQNPFSSSNRDQINLLTSINEQLKKKDEPKPITSAFKIPTPQTIETQTEPTQTSTQQTQTKKAKPIETQTENDQISETSDFDKELQDITSEFENLYKPEPFPSQFSDKVIPRTPIIEEPTGPIIKKPKDTTGESILEQVEKKSRGKPRLTEEEIQRREQEAELILRKKMNDKEIENQQKEEAKRELNERLAKQKEADRQEKVQRVENLKIEETRKKLIEKDNKKKQQTDNAFNVLVENTEPLERASLIEGYNRGYITENNIREKLKNLKNDSGRKKFNQEQINGFFKPPFR